MQLTRLSMIIALAASVLLACPGAEAATRSIAVFKSGRIVQGAGAKAPFSCQDEGLAFVFTETVDGQPPVVELSLAEPEEEEAQADLQVRITQSCGNGEATFGYGHDSATGQIGNGGDLAVNPREFSLSLPTEEGATATRTVAYRAVDDGDSEEAETFNLFGDRIVFFVEGTAGESSDRRDLLAVTIPANNEQAVDPDDLPEDATDQDRDSVDALNDACSRAGEDSELGQTCDEIAGEQDSGDPAAERERARRIARAVDPSEVTEATVAAMESIGRVQHENILNRLVAVRRGSSGVDVSGLRLAMNGHSMSASWIQDYLDAQEEQGGGSRLLSERWGVFLNGSFSVGDQDFQQNASYDFDIYDLTGGVDYRFGNGLVLGGAVGFTRFESDIVSSEGTLDSDSVTLQGFGTYSFSDRFYVDSTIAYADSDIDQRRTIDLSGIGTLTRQTVSGSTDASQFSASLTLNYQAALGGGWSLTNYGSVYFADTEVDPLSEQGSSLALRYDRREFDSLLSSLGARVSKVFNLKNGVMTTFADVAYKHESKDALNINTQFAAVNAPGPTVVIDDPDTTFGSAGFGASWVFPSGNQLFLRVNTLVLDDVRDRSSIYFGSRIEF